MSGMPLRDYRIHRYVNAFCPRCHEERPRPPALRGAAAVGLARGARRPRLARARLPRPRPGPHAVRRVAPRSSRYLEQWTAPTKVHGPDIARQLQAGARPRTRTACRRCRPSTRASCSRTSPTTATCAARPASPSRRPPRARSRRSAQVLASVDARLARENDRIDVLMLSGGEPTLYPWLEQLLDHLVARPIVRILINSNGLRIAQDDAFVETLRGTASGSRSTCSTTARAPRHPRTTAVPTSVASRSARSSGSRRPASS